jgi:hypothetical protein
MTGDFESLGVVGDLSVVRNVEESFDATVGGRRDSLGLQGATAREPS